MRTTRCVSSAAFLTLLAVAPLDLAAQSVLVEAKTASGSEVATIRTDSMRLLVPLHLLVGGLLFPDGTLQTTAAAGLGSVTSAQIVDGTIVNADISAGAGITDGKLATIQTAGKVANSATTATAASTANAIVARNAAGGFAAGPLAITDSVRILGRGSLLATGTYNSGTTTPPPASGIGTRFMWYPEKAAVRAGSVSGTQWDAANVGLLSTAFGSNAVASGMFSVALGDRTTASAGGAVALGSTATASGYGSFAAGSGTTASGAYATAGGANSTASGDFSFAWGSGNTAHGVGSIALGVGTYAWTDGALVIGQWNYTAGCLLAVGNGTNDVARHNALTLNQSGNLSIAGYLSEASDIRLKEAIRPLSPVLADVLRLNPIRYRFVAGKGHPTGEQIGLSAQDVEPIFPELVQRDPDGYLSLSYAMLTPILVRAVQEQQAQIDALKARNQMVESELAALRATQAEILRHLQALETGAGR